MFVCVAGKNNIAVDILHHLVINNHGRYELGVVCNKNEKGINSWQKSLRFWAEKYGVKEYKLEEIYDKSQLVFFSLEFDRIIKPDKFKDARLYNIHFSLLPKYKGMYTSAIPILNGENFTGVTLHEIDNGIDTGNIINQVKFRIERRTTCRELYLQYIYYGTELVRNNLEDILEGNILSIPQAAEKSSYYSKKSIDYSNLLIDLQQTADGIDKQIRAFTFREYQMPNVFKKPIITSKITNIKSESKPGTILFENKSGVMLSTIDYNIILYFDRLQELINACKSGDLSTVKEICGVPEHINSIETERGWSPLMVATYNGYTEIVKYLVLNGADIYAKSWDGTNLFGYAKDAYLNTGNDELMKLFRNLGLDESRELEVL